MIRKIRAVVRAERRRKPLLEGLEIRAVPASAVAADAVANAAAIRGTVFEDVNYGGGGAGRSQAASGGVGISGTRVELYGATGAYLSATTTDAAGGYEFSGLAAGASYSVRVVDSTVTSTRVGGTSWYIFAVPTYRTDATSGTAAPVVNEVGGANPAGQDSDAKGPGGNLSDAALEQSVARVSIPAGATAVAGVDFGFNFDTVVNTNDAGQGSLRQFIVNSNAIGGEKTLAQAGLPAGYESTVFMVPQAALTDGVAVFSVMTMLPGVTGPWTRIDGTTQTRNVGDTNPGVQGTGGTVGVDGLALAKVDKPEVEIRDGASVGIGLGFGGADQVLTGVAIHGFDGQDVNAGRSRTLIEKNFLGSTAKSFSDPGPGERTGWGLITSYQSYDVTIRNNLMGFSGHKGVYADWGGNLTVTGNEILSAALDAPRELDGPLGSAVRALHVGWITFAGNLIVDGGGAGVFVDYGYGTIANNTIQGNGRLGYSTAGINLNAANITTSRNVISANYGAGVLVGKDSVYNVITQNSIFDNGVAALPGGTPSGQLGIDLLLPSNDQKLGTAPFVTVNKVGGVSTVGGNFLTNFPILARAVVHDGYLELSGYTSQTPGAVIELFIGDGDPSGFGEGKTFLVTLTEGSADDLDQTRGSYGPSLINGLSQGKDVDANRFRFLVPLSSLPGVGVGTPLTATSTLNRATSEFSGQVIVANATTGSIQGTVFEDVNYGGGPGRDQAGSQGVGRPGVRVELYDAAGAFLTATTTDANGRYQFSGLPLATTYSVRVVDASVTSSRPGGTTAGLLAVQTYGTGVGQGTVTPVVDEVGGADPFGQDSGAKGLGGNLNDAALEQSVTKVKFGTGATEIVGVDFGFNFDTVVNANDAGQGSLRQFIVNSNALLNDGLDQDDVSQTIPEGVEATVFMIPGAGVKTITLASRLPAIADDDTWIDALMQAGAAPGAPVVELVGSSTLSNGLTVLNASRSLIRGLTIRGFTASGVAVLGDETIGGRIVGNVIAHNGKGVVVGSSATAAGPRGITISRNSIYANALMGIDLGDDGPTPNDDHDADSGPNRLLNAPIITSVTPRAIYGEYHGDTSALLVEFFIADSLDLSGSGEGRTFLMFDGVEPTSHTGDGKIVALLNEPLPAGAYLTAVVWDLLTGDTSEFSAIFRTDADLVVGRSTDPAVGVVGQELTYTILVTNRGSNAASGVIATENLPAGVEFVSASTSQGTVTQSDGVVTAALGDLAPGATATVTLVVRLIMAGDLTSTTTVDADQPIADPASRSSQARIRVMAAPVQPPAGTPSQPQPQPQSPVAVSSLTRSGFRRAPTSLTLGFSGPLDPSTSQDASNYRIEVVSPRGRTIRAVRVASASYDAAAQTVTLGFRRRLYPFARYRITVNGSTPGGVADASGRLIDGAGTNRPGSDYVRTFNRSILTALTARAVDAALPHIAVLHAAMRATR
ncbi:SdrD B-like domain-containing protein [Paludisphaera rhizosphaerae]|uniref:SdrD B-like domain-containing protein n=1 Tax=Paludisphaera rhizosphaerae TaxID=2711216 RepID=UPI0013EC834E|nr:SdrD B-like domain-containing protein [Paludisphaera rhizosphaerae]